MNQLSNTRQAEITLTTMLLQSDQLHKQNKYLLLYTIIRINKARSKLCRRKRMSNRLQVTRDKQQLPEIIQRPAPH